MNFSDLKLIDLNDWDNLVKDTYGKPYSFQQQEGCQDRGIFYLTIPAEEDEEDEMNEVISEKINGEERGVKFNVWLNTDPKTHQEKNNWDNWRTDLFWKRNFYPNIHTLANDLHKKELIPAGRYAINIDW